MQKPIILDEKSLDRLFKMYIYNEFIRYNFSFDEGYDCQLLGRELIDEKNGNIDITQKGKKFIENLPPSIILSKVRTQLISIIGYINILPLENLTKLITKALNQIPTAEFPIYLADEYLEKYSKEVYDQKVSETI
jgi:hypothetical protein